MMTEAINARFKMFALAVIYLTQKFPATAEYQTIKRQILASATSAAANYRAVSRGKSTADFLNKLKIAEEELDETLFWLELTVGVSEQWRPEIAPLYREADELLAIIISSIKTTRQKLAAQRKS